jgi:hypothetical protein
MPQRAAMAAAVVQAGERVWQDLVGQTGGQLEPVHRRVGKRRDEQADLQELGLI